MRKLKAINRTGVAYKMRDLLPLKYATLVLYGGPPAEASPLEQ